MIKCLFPRLAKLFLIKEMGELNLSEILLGKHYVCLPGEALLRWNRARWAGLPAGAKLEWRRKSSLLKQGRCWLLRSKGRKGERWEWEKEAEAEKESFQNQLNLCHDPSDLL